MKNRNLVLLALAPLLVSAGCGSKDATPATDSSPSPSAAASPGSNSNSTSTAVKNEPDASAAPGAAYRIQPANPNDPKYKTDPRLAGGG